MAKKKVMIPISGIIVVCIICFAYLIYAWFANSYRTSYKSCIASQIDDFGGEPENFAAYCHCFVDAAKTSLSDTEYNKWLQLYITDRKAAKEMSLKYKELLNSQFYCFVEKAPLVMWAETLVKIYTDVEGLSRDTAYCIAEEFIKRFHERNDFIALVHMKMQIVEQTPSFMTVEKYIKKSCLLRHSEERE